MTSGIVIDASVVVDLVLARDRAAAIAERIRGRALHAPHVIDLEVVHAIRRCWLAGLIYGSRMDEALASALDLPINRYSHKPLLPRILALRENVTAYDGAYVALAEILDLPLITRDRRLARSSGHTAHIEFIE
jgi:predicted nucleic acid-binding protein